MNRTELEKKYGKKLIGKILKGQYLYGCTIAINPDGSEDIPESDITGAIREMKGQKTSQFEWD